MLRRRPRPLGDRQHRPWHQTAESGQHWLRCAGGGAGRTEPRPDRRRRRCHPDRNLPGHAADQGRGERRQDRPAQRRDRHADLRASDGGDHRHLAGRPRYCRRDRGGRIAGCAADGAELCHRAAGDGRARGLAGTELARPDFGAAKRRAAGTGRWSHPLPAQCRRPGVVAGTLHRRGRGQPDRWLLRHLDRAHRGAGRDAAQACRQRRAARSGGAPRGLGPWRGQSVSGGTVAAGKRHLRDWRALQRQRIEEVARTAGSVRLGRLRRGGSRAGRRGFARVGYLHGVRRPR